MINPAQFVAQIRAETAKVVWPTRKEAGLTTIMVFIMATLVAILFFIADQFFAWGIDVLLNLPRF